MKIENKPKSLAIKHIPLAHPLKSQYGARQNKTKKIKHSAPLIKKTLTLILLISRPNKFSQLTFKIIYLYASGLCSGSGSKSRCTRQARQHAKM